MWVVATGLILLAGELVGSVSDPRFICTPVAGYILPVSLPLSITAPEKGDLCDAVEDAIMGLLTGVVE